MAQTLFRVQTTRLESSGPDAWTLYWKRDFEFLPGQVVAVSLEEHGPQRLYSLATGKDEQEAGILFNLVPEGWLTPQLRLFGPGREFYVSRPFGSFLGREGASVWIANGTGIAPYLSMVRSGLGPGKVLIHGARFKDFFYGQDHLVSRLADRYYRCASADTGEGYIAGRLTAHLETCDLPSGAPVYLCGSASMIVDARDILIGRGFPFKDILSEVYF